MSVRERSGGVGGVVAAQCVALAGWAGLSTAGAPLWAGAAAAGSAAAALLVRVHGRGAVGLTRDALRHRFPRIRPDAVLHDLPQPSGRPVGVRWDGPTVAAVVEVLPPPGLVTRLGRDRIESTATLPLAALAATMRRHDVVLDGIDVVAHGWRVLDATPAGQVYARLVGPLPAAAARTVWLVPRLDTVAAGEAVERRGGGAQGAARTVAAAARRLARALGDAGCAARILTAAEIRAAGMRIGHGTDPADADARWKHVVLPVGYNTGGVVDRRKLAAGVLAGPWAQPSLSTTVAVRLRPGSAGAVRVGAVVRSATRTADTAPPRGVRPVRGRERDLFLASLPWALPGLEDVVPLRRATGAELDALALPVGGCGQLVGSDDAGNAVAVRLTGAGVRSVHVAGELYLAQQIVVRAVATGARVLIHTDRAEAWRPLLDGAAGPDRLRIAGEQRGGPEFDTVLFDGVRPTAAPAHATVVHVHTHPGRWPRDRPTIAIVQPDAAGDRMVLTAQGRRIALTLVTIAAETALIGHPRVPDTVAAR